MFASATYGKLHIQPGSPCIDKGLDSAVQPGWVDMDSQSRIQGTHVDIGADESNGTTWPDQPVIVRVSPTGVDDAAHDGSTWALAKKTVQAGIDAASLAGGEVWVATGTYYEHVTLLPFAYMYGGFAGTETTRDQRSWLTNKSTLDGSGTGAVVSTRGYFVSALDGCTITNGSTGIDVSADLPVTNNTISGHSWEGISCASSSPIANNTLTGNATAIHCQSNSPLIVNNTISGNKTGIDASFPTSPYIANNIVAFNTTGVKGSTSSSPSLKNNCVYNPTGTNYSGLTAGAGDFSVDPLFVSPTAGDYHLQLGSPCKDKGLNSAVLAGSVDMDGEPRIIPASGAVDVGADEFTSYSVADAKAHAPDGRWLYLAGPVPVVITAQFFAQQAYYVERADRASGLRCSSFSLPNPGQTGIIQGIMDTINGERVLTQAFIVSGTLGTAKTPKPMLVTCKSLGGGPAGLQAGTANGKGLNNIGLLVRVAGHVEFIDTLRQYLVISDGSAVTDSDGHTGVRVIAPGMIAADLKENDPVTITGIVSCYQSGTTLYPRVLVRSSDDIINNAK